MWIMVSGPYTAGARSAGERAVNLEAMNAAALQLFQAGHVPVIGVNMALPVIAADPLALFDQVMMPLSLALAERCDACLRIGGSSTGADQEVAVFRQAGKPVYFSLEEVPPAAPRPHVSAGGRDSQDQDTPAPSKAGTPNPSLQRTPPG
jgi:hypothetical protein